MSDEMTAGPGVDTSYGVRFTFARMKEEGRKGFGYQGKMLISGNTVEVHGRKTGPTMGDVVGMMGGAVGGAVRQLVAEVRGSPTGDKVFPVDLERAEAFYDESRKIFAFWTTYARWMLVRPKASIFAGKTSRHIFEEMKQDLERVLGSRLQPAEMNRLDPWRQMVQWICIMILLAFVVLVVVMVILGMQGHFDKYKRRREDRSSWQSRPMCQSRSSTNRLESRRT